MAAEFSENKPMFKPGDPTIPASWLNRVASYVARRITVAGFKAQYTETGVHFSVDKESATRLPRRRTALIVESPVGQTLKCRFVRYADTPPKECSETCHYEFDGAIENAFDAYPDFGWKASDYDDLVHTAATIDAESPFLKVYWEDMVWRLEKPAVGGGVADIRECVVIDISGSRALIVQPIKLNDSGVYVEDGGQITVPTFGKWSSALWSDFKRFNALNSVDMVSQPLVVYKDGDRRVWLTIPFQPLAPNALTLAGGCRVT